MLKNFKRLVFGLTLFSLVGTTFAAESIVIKGSTTVLPIAQAALEAYMKTNNGVQISLSGAGSGDGIKALIDKTTDIANSSREIKKEEIDLAKVKGVNPFAHVIAYDAIIPVVNPEEQSKGFID